MSSDDLAVFKPSLHSKEKNSPHHMIPDIVLSSRLGLLRALTVLCAQVTAGMRGGQVEYVCVLCNNTVHRGGRGHRVITRWLGISRCPDRDLSPKHLLLLSNLKWKDSSVPLWSVLSDSCCFYTSEHQKQDDHGFFHVQDTDFFHHLHGSAGGWVTFLWFIWILGFY